MVSTLLALWLLGPAAPPPTSTDAPPVVSVVAQAGAPAAEQKGNKKSSMVFLHGVLAWVVAGVVGALVPLTLLTLPFFWLPALGPYGVMGVLAAIVWGAAVVGLGGGVAWLVMLLFSDVRSGVVYPLLTAALVGAGGVVLSFLAAAFFALPFVMLATFFSWVNVSPSSWWYWYAYPSHWYSNPFAGVATAVAMVVWSVGLVATAVAGPVAAAWVYDRTGISRDGDSIQVDLVTPRDRNTASDKPRERPPIVAIVPGPDDAPQADDKADRGGRRGHGRKPARSKGKSTVRAGASNKEVGASCTSDEECAVVCSTQKEFGGGMCTMPCNTTLDCPPGSACIDVASGICAVTCTRDSECAGFGGPRVCGGFYERNGGAVKACQAP